MTVLKATKENIIIAAKIVRMGGLVVYPTETVYGIGCDPFNVEAVKRILKAKGDRSKPLPVLAASILDAEKIAFVSRRGKTLASKFWPGPLTMVFFKKPNFPDVVTLGWNSVGVRIPDNDVTLHLLSSCGGLLIGSSANRTGEEPPRLVQEISGELKEIADVVLDGGTVVQGTPSTVVDLTSEKTRILREGPISLDKILDASTFDT
jgi:L-threonylcarbamoyladenylate synthase